MDNVAQESDETFAITLELAVGTLGQGANFRNRLEGVIIDSDGMLHGLYIKIMHSIYISPYNSN